jgi:hypothetical protein
MKQKEIKDSTQKRNSDEQKETRTRPKRVDTLMKQSSGFNLLRSFPYLQEEQKG